MSQNDMNNMMMLARHLPQKAVALILLEVKVLALKD